MQFAIIKTCGTKSQNLNRWQSEAKIRFNLPKTPPSEKSFRKQEGILGISWLSGSLSLNFVQSSHSTHDRLVYKTELLHACSRVCASRFPTLTFTCSHSKKNRCIEQQSKEGRSFKRSKGKICNIRRSWAARNWHLAQAQICWKDLSGWIWEKLIPYNSNISTNAKSPDKAIM